MSYMFYGCESLINLDLSNFYTYNLNNMSYIFYGCKSLKFLNLKNFNIQTIQKNDNMSHMFDECKSLKKERIICSDQTIIYYFWKQNVFNN
jgi:surface protein